MRIPESELILNPDGSIYHLRLKPGEIASTIISVGDQERVSEVSKYFDTIEVERQHREFKTHTGTFRNKRFTVISTGIGPDNIDIVFNELDALVNIDFANRTIKENKESLEIIRIGTSGALQPEIPVDSMILSETGIGFDNLLHFYGNADDIMDKDFSDAFMLHTNWDKENSRPYVVKADENLIGKFLAHGFNPGITTTNVGFYGPQGRVLRLALKDNELNEKIVSFRYKGKKITNLEMETAAIYGMSRLLGHRALSLNAILANRTTGVFSDKPSETIDRLIRSTLNILTQ